MYTHTHTHTQASHAPSSATSSILPSLAITAKVILREKNLTPYFPDPYCLVVTIPEEQELKCLHCWSRVMSCPGSPLTWLSSIHSSAGWLLCCPPPHSTPIQRGASHGVFFSSLFPYTHTHTHTLPLPREHHLPDVLTTVAHRANTNIYKVH
jgi:hypothetical protein